MNNISRVVTVNRKGEQKKKGSEGGKEIEMKRGGGKRGRKGMVEEEEREGKRKKGEGRRKRGRGGEEEGGEEGGEWRGEEEGGEDGED